MFSQRHCSRNSNYHQKLQPKLAICNCLHDVRKNLLDAQAHTTCQFDGVRTDLKEQENEMALAHSRMQCSVLYITTGLTGQSVHSEHSLDNKRCADCNHNHQHITSQHRADKTSLERLWDHDSLLVCQVVKLQFHSINKTTF